jgi:Pyridoxal-phosphate dependent enzyme
LLTISSIEAALERIRSAILVSPFVRSETFSQLTGCPLFLKLENRQVTGSFKERGALNKILLLTPDEKKRGSLQHQPETTRKPLRIMPPNAQSPRKSACRSPLPS